MRLLWRMKLLQHAIAGGAREIAVGAHEIAVAREIVAVHESAGGVHEIAGAGAYWIAGAGLLYRQVA